MPHIVRKIRMAWLSAIATAFLLTLSPIASAQELSDTARVTPQRIDQAIQKAKEYLYSQRNSRGNWELLEKPEPPEAAVKDSKTKKFSHSNRPSVKGAQWGGQTAVAVYALLASGENPQDPRLEPAINFLEKAEITGTYAVAMRCLVWNQLGDKRKSVRELAKRDAAALFQGQFRDEPGTGFLGYYAMPPARAPLQPGWYDHSAGQIAVLGMWACEQVGVEVPASFWEAADRGWKSHQLSDGAWGYQGKGSGKSTEAARPAIVAAGAATLFITQDFLNRAAGAGCTGNAKNEHIDRAIEWLRGNFPRLTEVNYRACYGLYSVERIGMASGLKYFGTFNWFESGADFLLKQQKSNGSWGPTESGNPEPYHNFNAVPDTCLGLLFMVRGRAPVLINKLQYDIAPEDKEEKVIAHWNERSRDIAHFIRWMGKEMERDVNWQIVNLKVPVNELADAPILYLSGNQKLNFTDAELDKLREFVEGGGMLLANADCGSAPFANSFRKVCAQLFPKYEFRELPIEHPIYTNQQYLRKNWKNPPIIRGLSNGARELALLYADADPARLWHTQMTSNREPFYQSAADIVLYTLDKQKLGCKGESYRVTSDTKIKNTSTIRVARLETTSNWDPEPGGWRRLAALLHNEQKIALKFQPIKPGEGKLNNKSFHIAHLTGTVTFQLTDPARQEIRTFVEGGGTLILDAAGGSVEFTAAAETELAKIFPSAAAPVVLEPSHPLYKAAGYKLEQVEFRDFARKRQGNATAPQLRAMLIDGRPAVLLSREDLSVGLVGQSVDGIVGYSPRSATELMTSMLLHAAGKRTGESPPPEESEKPKPVDP